LQAGKCAEKEGGIMLIRNSLDLAEARMVGEAALKAVETAGGAPISVAVADSAADLLYFARMDGASPNTATIAINKTYTAIKWRKNTRDLRAMLEKSGADIAWFSDPRYTLIQGGVLIKSGDGSILGAIGIGGRHPTEPMNDEDVGQVAAQAYLELES
jgi:uncharacterized protein GlcG (DUF336 family)